MYALLDNNQIVVGPRDYNISFFESYLQSKQIDFQLPSTYQESTAIEITPTIKLVKVTVPTTPQYNSLVEQLSGPFYDTSTDPITGYYEVVDRNLDAVKNELLSKLASIRYTKEISGTTTTLQGHTVTIDTDRGDDRNIWFQSFILLPDGFTQSFKFPKEQLWLDLTKTEIQQIVQAIMTHVQEAFDWEAQQAALINAATDKQTIVSLDTAITPTQQNLGV